MITKESPKIRKRLRKVSEMASLARLSDPVGQWFARMTDRRERKEIARYQLRQGLYGPPKTNLPAGPTNRVAFYFEKLKGITPKLAISPVFPDLYGRTGDLTPNPPIEPQGITTVAATSGSTASATFDMPDGYDSLVIYAGDFPFMRGRLILYVKVDSTTTPVQLYPYQCVTLKGVAGKTVSFGSQTVAKNSLSTINESVSIRVIPTITQSLVAPSGVTGTVQLDHGPPNLFQATQAHIYLSGEFQSFSIAAAPVRRDIFMIESDGVNDAPVRHVHIPANQTVKVNCRYQFIVLFSPSRDINSIDVTCPSGAIIPETTPAYWRPSFTPTASTIVSTLAELKAAINGSTYDDILIAPGTYDLSTSGYRFDGYNGGSGHYAAGMSRTIRIRSTTGNPDDVVFTGAPWYIQLLSGNSWILQGVSWSLDGVASNFVGDALTAMVNFDGNVSLCDFKYFGAPTDVANDIGQISWRSTLTVGAVDVVAAWGTISKAGRDGVTCNSQASQAAQLQLIGTTHDGNGPNSNDQLITAHTGGVVVAWGSRFKSTYTTNNPRVASDGSTSLIHLNYCYSRSGDFTSAGLSVNGVSAANASGQMLLFCDFPQMAGMYYMQYVAGSRAIQTSTNGPLVFTSATTFISGCDLTGNPAGTGFERLIYGNTTQATIYGSRLTHGFNIANQFVIDMRANASGNAALTMRNVLMRALNAVTGSTQLNIAAGSGGTESMDFKNVLIDGDGSMAISSSTAASTSDGCRFKRASAPPNWSTVVTAGTNTFSTAAFDLDSNDIPTASGNCDSGVDPGFVGSIDIWGRPFLGGSFRQGCAERQEVRPGALLYPMIWI